MRAVLLPARFERFLSAAALRKALGAVDRLVVSRLERHLGRLAARCAYGVEHLTRLLTARCVLARLPAFRATDRIVFEIVSCIEFLFAGGKREFLAAIPANQCSVLVHDVLFPFANWIFDLRFRLTWSLPPHSPAGGFAPKLCSPLLPLSTVARRPDLLLSRTMLTGALARLCGSFRLRLASTCNHRPESGYLIQYKPFARE